MIHIISDMNATKRNESLTCAALHELIKRLPDEDNNTKLIAKVKVKVRFERQPSIARAAP